MLKDMEKYRIIEGDIGNDKSIFFVVFEDGRRNTKTLFTGANRAAAEHWIETQHPTFNRVLHMRDNVKTFLAKVRAAAKLKGVEDKLDSKLDYLRTYSGGPEEKWHTELFSDMPHHDDQHNVIAIICRRGPNKELIHFMTIGMIWDESRQDWGCHS